MSSSLDHTCGPGPVTKEILLVDSRWVKGFRKDLQDLRCWAHLVKEVNDTNSDYILRQLGRWCLNMNRSTQRKGIWEEIKQLHDTSYKEEVKITKAHKERRKEKVRLSRIRDWRSGRNEVRKLKTGSGMSWKNPQRSRTKAWAGI